MSNNAGTDNTQHARQCKICNFVNLKQVNDLYEAWFTHLQILDIYPDLVGENGYASVEAYRQGLHRHAVVTGVFAKRDANIRGCLQRLNTEGMTSRGLTEATKEKLAIGARELAVRMDVAAAAKGAVDRHLHMSAGDMTEEQIERFINAGHEQIVADKAVNVADDQPTEEGVGHPPAGGGKE